MNVENNPKLNAHSDKTLIILKYNYTENVKE